MKNGAQSNTVVIKQKVQRYLDKHEIKHAQKGYQYLAYSISIGCRNPEKLPTQTELLNQVAFLFGTRSDSVERAIRYALLGTNMTNKEFIRRAVDELQN